MGRGQSRRCSTCPGDCDQTNIMVRLFTRQACPNWHQLQGWRPESQGPAHRTETCLFYRQGEFGREPLDLNKCPIRFTAFKIYGFFYAMLCQNALCQQSHPAARRDTHLNDVTCKQLNVCSIPAHPDSLCSPSLHNLVVFIYLYTMKKR